MLVLAACVFNYPRIWWQEVVNCYALVWAPLFFVSVGILFKRVIQGGLTLTRAVCLILQLACLWAVAAIAWPYVSYSKNGPQGVVYADPVSILLVDEDIGTHARGGRLELPRADIVVKLSANTKESVDVVASEDPSVSVQSLAEGARKVVLSSTLPFSKPPKRDVGYAALPAIFAEVVLAPDTTLEIGALDLLPSMSQETFVASRLTSRRVASLLRFSSKPRMVVGGFRAPITSQIVAMYPEQVRLKSILFNQGAVALWGRLRESFARQSALNIFVAKNIVVEQVVEHHIERDGWRGISFVARVPLNKN